MKKYLFFILCLIFLFDSEDSSAQENAQISGTIFMPVMSRGRRKFRGRIYRNRLSSAKKTNRGSKILKSSFIDVFVSAHMMSTDSITNPLDPVTIIQINAEFVPRVVAVTQGTKVRFINRDRFFHNVFSITPGSRFNIGRKRTGVAVGQTIDKLGETKIFCDIHAQMNATIICLDTPYFTRVGPDGKYRLSGLPEGTYEIKVYHPDLPGLQDIIDIEAGELVSKSYTLSR